MMGSDSRLVTESKGDVQCVGFLDQDILEESSIQKIADEIGKIIEESVSIKLLINFENVEHLSSAALGALISINNKVREKGGQLRLSNINPQIYEVFAITKLNKLFQIHDTVEQGLDSFQ